MSKRVAGVYELGKEIGAGGGGVVYLGEHVRLKKKIILKADKRSLRTKEEKLRREVDILKNLSHTYIPQVYDFVPEDGVVYTVMDYIEGESLDKLLARGQLPSQPQMIGWACQLLEALDYLHNQSPHGILHGDIKPANIMLRPNGDVCLIDFNIALALGEDGAVKVGFSRGYASPEHYGADYISRSKPASAGSFFETFHKRGTVRAIDGSEITAVSPAGGFVEGTQVEENITVESETKTAYSMTSSGCIGDSTEVDSELENSAVTLVEGTVSCMTQVDGDVASDETQTEQDELEDITLETIQEEPEDVIENVTQLEGNQRNAQETDTTCEGDKGTDTLAEGVRTENALCKSSEIKKDADKKSSGNTKGILLDVRSDIYCLGATLYHLISGQRPAQDAREVVPLGPDICSKTVSEILQKAMAPQPYDRYQTAAEMLEAFETLHVRDDRTVRHRKRMFLTAAALTGLFLSGGCSTFVGLKQLENRQTALTLAEYSANALAEGNISEAVSQALKAIPMGKNILEAPVTAQAQKALTDALGVYDLAEGFKSVDTIELPGAPFDIVLSPEGTRAAVVYAYETAVYDLSDCRQIARLPTQESALSDCVFIDETYLIYAGNTGVTGYDLEKQQVMWTGETATTLALSADRKTVAAVNRDEDRAVVYNAGSGQQITVRSFDGQHLSVAANDIFADPKRDIFALNHDGSMLAVSFSNGGLMVFDLDDPEEDLIVYDTSEYKRFEGGFYGKYFAFTAQKSGESLFGILDVENAAYIGGYTTKDKLILQADADGIYLASGSLLVRVEPETMEEVEAAYTEHALITSFSAGGAHTLTATDDNAFSFFDSGANQMSMETCQEQCEFVCLSGEYAVIGNRNEPSVRVMRLEAHNETLLLTYDARYHHDEARISQDGNTFMLFSIRGFQLYDREGKLLAQVELPNSSQIYDQQFRRDEQDSWLEVIWYDGTVRCYSAKDGALRSEETKEAPKKDLYETFVIDQYKITSPLHGAPEVYDLKSDRLVKTLPGEDYLTYVTQTGPYIITEYMGTAGGRYGLLLDENLQLLAKLPGLCDVVDDMLLFDFKSGNLRQCRLYSLQELTVLGESYSNQ